jgi:hypothetical protein
LPSPGGTAAGPAWLPVQPCVRYCMYMHICIYIYIYIYTHTHTYVCTCMCVHFTQMGRCKGKSMRGTHPPIQTRLDPIRSGLLQSACAPSQGLVEPPQLPAAARPSQREQRARHQPRLSAVVAVEPPRSIAPTTEPPKASQQSRQGLAAHLKRSSSFLQPATPTCRRRCDDNRAQQTAS